jgi:hypothetical protein
MWNWRIWYERVKKLSFWSTIMYASAGIILLCAVKVIVFLVLGLLGLLTTTSAPGLALFAIGYVIFKGLHALYQEHTDDR